MSDGGFVEDATNEAVNAYLKRGCGTGVMLGRVDSDLKAEIEHVMFERPEIPTTALRRALEKRADKLGEIPRLDTLNRHRKGVCGCERNTG